jgi:hypothetical protein
MTFFSSNFASIKDKSEWQTLGSTLMIRAMTAFDQELMDKGKILTLKNTMTDFI